ncbi:prenylcysteine alpha-carboxyl methylesterase [Marchantia polymorpha subsp. ruderalis]|uniref:protein-S-isoprenylcysteine alpha-carbonyl methylesterase n=2 Tax=Marchantia polymorpha TaxID=3197 RepID=A0AAF6B971_MARPO|nr:hypothetical protein MARPO_0174s0010 [Marchantia polymorpha]BBN08555.1 hypothetical protein Mp_4g12480 [Marchantia polymorpha subsp. ruderalis]|eukprot:PTQ28082.1 hypothetical protein MARPO_0174s0010 [Marchantia polymorpha]
MLRSKAILVYGGRRCCCFSRAANCLIRTSAVISRFGPQDRGGSKLSTSSFQRSLQNHPFSTGTLQIPTSRYFCSWEIEAKMRTVTDVKKEPLSHTTVEELTNGLNEGAYDYRLSTSFGASAVSEHAVKLTPSKSEGETSSRSGLAIPEVDGRDTKVDIRKLKDEVASLTAATPVLRVKSGNHLSRHASEVVYDQQPLLRGQQRRRRCFSEDDVGFVPLARQHSSFRDDVEHAAHETWLITRLSFRLLRYLGVGYRWITKMLALGVYAILLMPGFLQVGYQYFFSKHVHRSIVYGDQPRNRLDLYLPDNTDRPKPVVIFVTGGAWIIGYKAWGSLLGLQLVERDVIVCCIDYRNFPQGCVSEMVEDVCNGIGFIVNNIAQYGGDPNRLFLAGQSAGSHLAACALVGQAKKEIGQGEGDISWKCSQIKGFLGISGGYNLLKLVDHFHNRGLYRSIFLSVMGGEISLPMYSPELTVLSESFAEAIPLLPPIYLFHGTGDYSIPSDASATFADALRSKGATVKTRFYPDKTHTDVFLQDPMRGGHDVLFEDLLAIVHADDEEARTKDAQAPLRPRLVPEFLLQLARKVSPF